MYVNVSEPIGTLMVEPVRQGLGQDGVLVSDIITDDYIHITKEHWVELKARIDSAMQYYSN